MGGERQVGAVTLTTEEAVLELRRDPRYTDLVRDAYLGPDVEENAARFLASEEFAAVLRLLGDRARGGSVLDVGAGTGIAAYAFARSGAREVVALEPDEGDVVGQGAMRRISAGLPITIATGVGEALPFPEARFDVVYARQVLHHANDLDALVRECARVLVPGGIVLATREHVVDDAAQLRAFLASHPVHQLAGGENAHSLDAYRAAFRGAGLVRLKVLGPYDSVINAFPAFRDEQSLADHPRRVLEGWFGAVGRLVARIPGAQGVVRRSIDEPVPGRLYSFVGRKS